MTLSEQERTAARADLEKLTGELVRLYQLREQLKLALGESDADTPSAAAPELPGPVLHLVPGTYEGERTVDLSQRQALRAQLTVIKGGLIEA
jgi:hypothetical protein